MEKRFSMWGLICEPRPSRKRPSESVWRSLAVAATVIGLRAKATAIPVPTWIRRVCSAARTRGRKGSWLTSADQIPSYPAASAASACPTTPAGSNPMVPSTSMGHGSNRPDGAATTGTAPGLHACQAS